MIWVCGSVRGTLYIRGNGTGVREFLCLGSVGRVGLGCMSIEDRVENGTIERGNSLWVVFWGFFFRASNRETDSKI